MGIFRKSSTKSNGSNGSGGKVQLTKDDVKNYKIRTGAVHDPILAAVNEQQPFQAAADDQLLDEANISRNSYMANGAGLHDVFGKPIQRPDISNPTRSRDERPLDTIRSFEYSITGDLSYRDRLESDNLGFKVRQDFPKFGASNPYANNNDYNIQQGPVHSFSGTGEAFEQGVYQAPVKNDRGKGKKKGFFGRKKN